MSRKTKIFLAVPLILLLVTPLTLPETPEDLKAMGIRVLELIPELLKGVWQDFLDFLLNLWGWLRTFFDSYLAPFLQNIWQGIWEQRKETVTQEFEKEKQTTFEEIKTLLSKFPLWEKVKGFLK